MVHPARHAAWLVWTSVCLVACSGGGGSGAAGPSPSTSTSPPAGSSAPANSAPVITLQPTAEVLVGRELKLRPSVSDADGQSLSFSIENKPSWLSFSAPTGEISGIPAEADVGTYAGIRITVSDGQAAASVTCSITVLAATSARATVSWAAPTQRTDGTPLTNLAGFRIYYGAAADDLSQIIEIRDPGARSWVVEDLTRGAWYFAATAFDQTGAESSKSNTVSKTIA